MHTIAPFPLRGGRRGAAAARPAVGWAQGGRVHSGDKGVVAPGAARSRVPCAPGAAAPLFPRPFGTYGVSSALAGASGLPGARAQRPLCGPLAGAAVPRLHGLVSFPPIIKTRRDEEIPKPRKTYSPVFKLLASKRCSLKNNLCYFFLKCKHSAYESQDDYRV